MNIPVDRRLGLSAARPGAAPLSEATAVAMGDALCAVFFDRPAGRRGRLQAFQDGVPVPPPFIAAELALRSGDVRHVLLLPQGVHAVLARRLELQLGGHPMAEIDPAWLQLPQGDLAALTAQLSEPGLRRLLRVMLTTGASLFAADAQADLARTLPALMDLCGVAASAAIGSTRIAGRLLVSFAMTGGPRPGDATDPVALVDGRLQRLKKLDCFAEGDLLHLLLPGSLTAAQIVAFAGTAPMRLAAPDSAPRQLSAAAWLQGRSTACSDWLAAQVGRDTTAAVMRSRAEGGTEPKITVRHLSATSDGLLHLLVLQDPSRVVRRLVLERDGQQVELTPLHGADGTAILLGFADLPGAVQAGQTCQIRALHRSGRVTMLAQSAVAAFDGAIPAGFQDAWVLGMDALSPLARARAGFRRPQPPFTTQHFGPEQACCLRIVTSVGGSADLIRARAALILAERHSRPVEVVCTMTEGPLAVAARHALAQTAAIYGIAHRLVLLPGFATETERLRAALAHAGDAPALVLGGDVLPQMPGWLGFWLRRLRQRDALGAALLASDGAIAATCAGQDPRRGLPAAHLPAPGGRADRPLPDCLALSRAGIARLLASGAPHPDPALWIADAFGGSARTETRFPFRRYGPAAAPDGFTEALAEVGFSMMEKDRA